MPRNEEFNGHKNWTHWNVSLWINNDEFLYNLALDKVRKAKSRGLSLRIAARWFRGAACMTTTPDGARISIVALVATFEAFSDEEINPTPVKESAP